MSLESLYQKYNEIDQRLRELILTSPFSDSDNRNHVFGVLRSQIIHYEIMLHILHARYERIIPSDDAFREIIGIGYDEQEQWIEFQIIIKNSFLTLSNFIIENYFKNLLFLLDTTRNPPTGFYNIVDTLLSKITISDKPRKLEILNTMAMLRNSFHNNGIHVPVNSSWDLFDIVIDGECFHFEKGIETNITESMMAVLVKNIVEIIYEITSTIEIQNLLPVPLVFIPRP